MVVTTFNDDQKRGLQCGNEALSFRSTEALLGKEVASVEERMGLQNKPL